MTIKKVRKIKEEKIKLRKRRKEISTRMALTQIYATAFPIVLTALMSYVVWMLQEQRKQKAIDNAERDKRILEEKKLRENNSNGTMLLLRVKLIEYHDRYMARGTIPSYAYENFMEMYKTYHALGGNGTVTKMKNEIEELHLNKKEERG